MANQFNRLNYVLGKGGFLRLIWKPVIAIEQCNLVVLPHNSFKLDIDPGLSDKTEGDSLGYYMAPGVFNYTIQVNLRRRQSPMSLDAFGIIGLSFVDQVIIDDGTTGNCMIINHMGVGPYERDAPQASHVTEGFSLHGGALISSGVTIPAYAVPGGTIPAIAAYYVVGGSVPTGL